jgi:hypothetical protein
MMNQKQYKKFGEQKELYIAAAPYLYALFFSMNREL